MPPKWTEFSASDEFKSLPPEGQEKARVGFFDQHVAPTLAPERVGAARQYWDAKTLPKPAEPAANVANPEANVTSPSALPRPKGFTGALTSGARKTLASTGATVDAVSGDTAGIERAANEFSRIGETVEQSAFHKSLAAEKEAGGDDTAWQGIKNVFRAALDQPTGAAHETVGQLPNSAPAVVAGMAFAKAGASAGRAIPHPAGPLVGGVLGMALGYFLGNGLVETGNIAIDKADDGTVTDEEAREAVRQGAIKSGVITFADIATLGLNKFVAGAPGRIAEQAITNHLSRKGVDLANAVQDKAMVREMAEVGADAFKQSMTMGKRAGRNAAGIGME